MLEESVRKIIQDTRMNLLKWERKDKNTLITEAEVPGYNKGETAKVNVRLEKCYCDSPMGFEYYLHIGDKSINDHFKPVSAFGKYMFLEDLRED